MLYKIRHRLRYRYASPATLGPQTLRLRPREDGSQRLLDFHLEISPTPSLRSVSLDEHGTVETRAWFLGPCEGLEVVAESTVETLRVNPFDFVVDPAWEQLPWGQRLLGERPGLLPALDGLPEPEAAALALGLRKEAGHGALPFLMRLNRWLHEKLAYEHRAEGPALAPAETLRAGRGACRDLAVLFCAAARAEGIPARFVSGYHEGDPDQRHKDLHAWAEVFLPGGGWRGFDPSCGLACSDRHIAIAASPQPGSAGPVSGSFGAAQGQSTLETEVSFV